MVGKSGYLQGIKLPISEYMSQSQNWQNSVLGVQCYARDVVKMTAHMAIPTIRVPIVRLDSDDSICDVWLTDVGNQPKSGQYNAINYRYNDDLLFGVIELSEAMFEPNSDKTPFQQATESAYNQIFSLLDQMSFPYLFRVRNYMADINGKSFGLERYLQFNLGRQDAFLTHGRDVEGNVPAACALGFELTAVADSSKQNSLTISFLAGRILPQNIENPRQISAYQYPQQYGPRSPTFSRASLVSLGEDNILFLSGTASIVGHKTLHLGDVVAQTRETIDNIKAVITQVNRQLNEPQFDLSKLHYTVYVRHLEDLDSIRTELKRHVGDALKAVYLQAYICREDLLVEIEATAGHSIAALTCDENSNNPLSDHLK